MNPPPTPPDPPRRLRPVHSCHSHQSGGRRASAAAPRCAPARSASSFVRRLSAATLAIPAVLTILTAPVDAAASDEAVASTYQQAVSAFENGDFGQARALFAGLIEAGHFAPEVFYNLGNTFYRLDDPGSAALQYRRATLLAPRHAEALQNLRFLRREYGFVESGSEAIRLFTRLVDRRTWTYLAVGGSWLALVAGIGLITLRRGRMGAGLVLLAGLMIAGTAATALIARSRFLPAPTDLAVITAKDARALTAPASDAGMVIDLPPGSAVRVLEQRGKWDYVAIDDETRGWVPVEFVEPLWPFDSSLID